MNLRQIIMQLVQIAIAFAFPAIWNFITSLIPGWPLDPQTTMSLLITLGVTLISWLLGVVGIRSFVTKLKTQGLAADVKAHVMAD